MDRAIHLRSISSDSFGVGDLDFDRVFHTSAATIHFTKSLTEGNIQ